MAGSRKISLCECLDRACHALHLLIQTREEHQRRSPECAFFVLTQFSHTKPTRGKKGRPSKASRLSTQSNVTVNAEGRSINDAAAEEGDSIASAATSMTTASTVSKVGKKAGKGKKGKGKPQSKVGNAVAEDIHQGSNFVEPEDDDFEVKVAPIASNGTRGKKRSSNEMNAEEQLDEINFKSPKRRATRARSSTAKPEPIVARITGIGTKDDTHITDTEDIPPRVLSESKKGEKPSRRRASSRNRKASHMSTASKASLRDIPGDDEIDAALEADLERPLTDDEVVEGLAGPELKTRRLTRSRPGSKTAPASMAPARTLARVGTTSVKDIHVEVRVETVKIIELDASYGVSTEAVKAAAAYNRENNVKTKVEKGRTSTKGPSKSEALDIQDTVVNNQDSLALDQVRSPDTLETAQNERLNAESITDVQIGYKNLLAKKQPAGRKFSKQRKLRLVSGQLPSSAQSVLSISQPVTEAWDDVRSSVLAAKTLLDESGHESDASTAGRATIKQCERKDVVIKQRKISKQQEIRSRVVKDFAQAPAQNLEAEGHIEHNSVDSSIEAAQTIPHTASKSGNDPVDVPEAEQKPINVVKPKSGRGRPKGKATSSNLPAVQQRSETTLDHSIPTTNTQVITDAVRVSISAASPEPQPTFTPTLRPPTHKSKAPSPAPSPQSSDAENQPPSSRPSQHRPPLFEASLSRPQTVRVPLAASTPNTSPSQRNMASQVQTIFPWKGLDLEHVFATFPNVSKGDPQNLMDGLQDHLSSPEKKMSVEEWIKHNAEQGEDNLRNECERLVGRFEDEGNRALRALEGIVCQE